MIGGDTAAKTDGEIVRHPVFYLHSPLISCRAGLRFFGPRPDLLRVRRRYAKVISRNIDTPPDNNALVKFAWVGQKVCGAGLRLPEFHSGMYLYGPTSQLKLIGSSTFSTSVTVERFS